MSIVKSVNGVNLEKKDLLSDRERQIAQLAAEGLTDKEIAIKLHVSVTTIRTYWMRMRRKLEASNRAHAIVRALDQASDPVEDIRVRLLQDNPLGVVALSKDGHLLAANDAFLDILGHDRDSFGRTILRWTDFSMDAPRDGKFREAHVETLRRRDGKSVRVFTTGASLPQPAGIDVNCVVNLSDMSAQMASELSE